MSQTAGPKLPLQNRFKTADKERMNSTRHAGSVHPGLLGSFLIAVAVAALCFACRSTEPKPEPPPSRELGFMERLSALLDKGDLDGAIALFDTLPVEEAQMPDKRLLKSSIMLSAGYLDEARNIAQALIEENKDDIEARFLLSNIEAASGKLREQRNLLEGIIKDDPDHVPSLNDLGLLALNAKSYKLSAKYFDHALEQSPHNIDALNGRANLYRLQRDPDQAEKLLAKAIDLYPNSAATYNARGRFYRETDKLKEALADLDMAKKLDPENYWIAYDRGRILLDMNRNEEALSEFGRATDINPDNFIAYVYSAGVRDRSGDLDGAERDYAALARLRPDYYFAYEGLGIIKMQKREYAAARDAFLEAYKQAPSENNYAILAAINALRAGVKQNEIKPFVDQAMRKIDRSKTDYYILRLFFDFSGDADVSRRVDSEKNARTKAQMLFYLANYYAIKGNDLLADKYFIEFRDMGRRDMIEWRLNESILEDRNIFLGHKN
jgi:tetratricopeptide (TPR) repeat protein